MKVNEMNRRVLTQNLQPLSLHVSVCTVYWDQSVHSVGGPPEQTPPISQLGPMSSFGCGVFRSGPAEGPQKVQHLCEQLQ